MSTPDVSRRDFVRWLAAGLGVLGGSWFLRACGLEPARTPVPPRPTGTPVPPTLPPTAVPTQPTGEPTYTPAPTAPPTTTPLPIPDLAVARGGEPADLVRRAIAALGGMERFVRPGDDVIVKPNICISYHSYEYAATTNPWVVGEVVRMCREAGAGRVRVMDSPFGGTAEQAYAVTGIGEQVGAAGGEMEIMSSFKFVPADMSMALDLHNCDIYEDVLNADVVISVPIAKHHGLARLTLGMKNLMGVIRDRPAIHRNIGQRLADLTARIRPALTVVDAVRILTANGPTGGNLADVQQLDTVIASPDIVAADAFAGTLFGLQPDKLDYVRAGAAMGLGRMDLENLIIGEV
jgi:uncharacterized protein (DUF362 family)